MPSYQDYLSSTDEERFEDILDEFITGLLSMTNFEKSNFLKFFDASIPKERKETEPKHIYNIINNKDLNDDIFNSIKVSYLEKVGLTALSTYDANKLEVIKLRLISEGIDNISYRTTKNPNNNKTIHSILFKKKGE